MKQHKLALLVALICTFVSLAAYLCGACISFYRNDILKDISLAILSSAVFVVVLSAIGYRIERSRVLNDILLNNTSGVNDFLTSGISNDNSFTRQALTRIVHQSLDSTSKLKNSLVEYYCGSIRKDRNLQNLLNIELCEYAKELSYFEVYLFSPNPQEEIISSKFEKLKSNGEKMYDSVISWLEGTNIKIGEEFDLGDNFIKEYENE